MSNITKHQNEATICYKGACAAVYDEVADIVNVIVLTIVFITGVFWLSKILK